MKKGSSIVLSTLLFSIRCTCFYTSAYCLSRYVHETIISAFVLELLILI